MAEVQPKITDFKGNKIATDLFKDFGKCKELGAINSPEYEKTSEKLRGDFREVMKHPEKFAEMGTKNILRMVAMQNYYHPVDPSFFCQEIGKALPYVKD